MADYLCASVSNADAKPRIPNDPTFDGGLVRQNVETIAKLAADTSGQVYRVFRVKSNIRLASFTTINDALSGDTSWKIGVYRTPGDGGAVVAVGSIAGSFSLAAATGATDRLFTGSGATSAANIKQPVWQQAGMAADPGGELDLCLTGVTLGGTAAGNITCRMQWVN